MEIIKVVVDELPQEGCLYCRFREIRQKGRSLLNECAVADGFLDNENLHIRPDYCPLVLEDEYRDEILGKFNFFET